jgi:hypothetical protein
MSAVLRPSAISYIRRPTPASLNPSSRPSRRWRDRPFWGQPHIEDTHYLRIFVRKLRQKIETDATRPKILLTELGVGYRLAMPNEVEFCPVGRP